MAWRRWARWTVLVAVLGATFGRWCLRAIAMGDPPISRLTLVPRYREAEEGREVPGPDALAALAHDAEVRVSAPEDARSVSVILPSGEARSARYDPDRRVWTLRFRDEEGTRARAGEVGVRIVGEDGRVEALRLLYTIDRHAAAVSVSVRPVAGDRGRFEIRAQQRVMAEDRATDGLSASVAEDPRHVEVRMPDGRLVILGLVEGGLFRGYWRPRSVPSGSLTLRVVAVDRSLNERVSDVRLAPLRDVTADGG
jgi:hypothetical protein